MIVLVFIHENAGVILMEELDVSCCKYTLDSFNNGDILK